MNTTPVRRTIAPVAEPIEEKAGNGLIWFLGLLTLLMVCGVGLALLARNQEAGEEPRPKSKAARRASRTAS